MSDSVTPARPPRPDEPMLTFRSGGWVILLTVLIVASIAFWRVYVIVTTYDQRAIGDGVNIESYQFDLSNLIVPRDRMRPISRTLRRDGLPALTDPPKIVAAEFEKEIDSVQDELDEFNFTNEVTVAV